MCRRLVSCCLMLMAICFWGDRDDRAAAGDRDDVAQIANADQPLRDHAKVAEGVIRRNDEGFRALYTMNRDGSNVKYLTAAPGMISSATPEWSHDGKMVAFDASPEIDAVVEARVFVAAVDGPFKGLVLDLGYGNTPSWSPDDRQIAYMINSSNPIHARGGTWIMNAEGTKRRWISEGWYCRWSPDGKLLCCHGTLADGRSSLVVVDVATQTERPLLTAEGWHLQDYGGTWSPDGKRIVFVGSYQGNDCLATIGLNGPNDSIHVLYTDDDSSQRLVGPPAWSPDGRQIVFAMQPSSEQGPRRWWKSYLYSMAADVPCAPVLLERTKVGNINRGMNWSPDSKKVVFSSER